MSDETPVDEKRYPEPNPAHPGFIEGFLAGHEAATRTRVVSTVTDLDALPVGSVVLDADEQAWQKPDALDTWASGQQTLALTSAQLAADGPFRVLYDPEETR